MDFKQARYNMVEQQIRPWNMFDLNLLNTLHEIPREEFVEQKFKNLAYADMPIPLENGSISLEPKIVARLIQTLQLKSTNQVLEIGTGTGYATAILAKNSKIVDTYDLDAQQLNKAKLVLNKLNILNVNYFNQDYFVYTLKNLHLNIYDSIYVGGALHIVPDCLKNALKNYGKIVAIVGKQAILEAVVITKINNKFSTENIFETNVPYLKEIYYRQTNDFEF